MIADRIEATLLKPDATFEEYEYCVANAVGYGCHGLILPTSIIADPEIDVQRYRWQDKPRIGTVVGFPLGNNATREKVAVIDQFVKLVDDFDVVLNISFIKSGYYDMLADEIDYICEPSKYPYRIKFIIETPLLTDDEIVRVSNLIMKKKEYYPALQYIKTATGFNGKPTPAQVSLIRMVIEGNSDLHIKVSGGVRTMEDIKTYDKYGIGLYGVGYPHFVNLIEEEKKVIA